MRKTAVVILTATCAALPACVGLAFGQSPLKAPGPPAAPGNATAPSLPLKGEDAAALQERFTREVWPLLERANGGCISCHNAKNPSQLHFSADGPAANFKKLLAGGFFDPENPSGIIARVVTADSSIRMPPPPFKAWTDDEISSLRSFVTDLYDRVHRSGIKADELFPAELLDPYTGKPVRGGPDNTFLTYRQLRGKIKTIFSDEWRRDERDLFQENIAQFNGADFIKRFDESTKASATFLSAVDALARDVASRAYLASSGPFAGRAENLPAPLGMKTPNPAYRAEIVRLYRRMLYRNPTEAETAQAFQFIRNIYAAQKSVAKEDSALDFELEVQDDQGRATTRALRIAVSQEALGLYQEFLDQTLQAEGSQIRKKLDGTFTFKPGARGQRLELTNTGTSGNVSLAALEVTGPLPETTVKRIAVTDPQVSVQGAWQRREADGFVSFEDGNNNKGSSRIEVPVEVPKEGSYEVVVVWRRAGSVQVGRGRRSSPAGNADAVPVELYSADPSRIAHPRLPEAPPQGEARFVIDQTVDTIPFWDLKTTFRFGDGPDQGVEIQNGGTRKRVVADAVRFVSAGGDSDEFVLDDPDAEGGWPKFVFPSFRPFNLVGSGAVTDNNEKKGEMKLLYRPARSSDWKADHQYRVRVVFPGQVDNDTRVPVVVRAKESTPIVQMSAPLHVVAGAAVTLDASTTYNLQGTSLRFTWRQLGGPRIKLADAHSPKVTFTSTPMSAQQAAWEGLCHALMKHPDFLFTRPRSLAFVNDPADRRRLQLVKIAQDLVARPPTDEEVRQIESGAPLSKLIDQYLDSQEFRDFYFHRIRLVLESRGTNVDDEPVRLWSYVVFNDRPFKEVLTADYTVDAAMQKQPRPAYHGKTGLLTMKGFIKGKPGLPHFNYAAMVTEKFLGYVYEVPPSIVAMREGITAVATTAPGSVCYSCHKVLTPLAHQRLAWDDEGSYTPTQGGKPVDDTDRGLVPAYAYRGKGMEAFALAAVNKERFVRTILQTHFVQYFGREMRYQEDERALYKRLWDNTHQHNFSVKSMIRALMTSPEYLDGRRPAAPAPTKKPLRPTPSVRRGRTAKR